MPLYEYRCEKCGRVTEFLESFSSKKQHTCSHCGSKRMVKEMSAFGTGGSGGGGCGSGGGSPFS
ncbi:MAG: FmdB family zinc ribbon protein [Limisphaerales bacterium]|jgi:putative FmdB family regulatory protein